MIRSRKNERNRRISKAKRILRTALLLVLCACLTGCSTILGTGEITVVTAPPIITPRVIVYDAGANGSRTRYDIEGTDAFYLLPGIENLPEKMQDFNCLDYTDDGSFVYYYCAPAYITAEEVAALKGTDGTAPGGAYPEIDRSNASETDAMIFMKYNPKTRAYHVLDAQSYSHTTANSETGGEANTGVDFYASGIYSFYTLSHCYGCRLSGQHRYFIFDQNGTATVYDEAGKVLSQTSIGDLITAKVQETANELNLAAKQKGDSSKGAGINDAGKEMTDAVKELEGATGKTYDTGTSGNGDIVLNCLIKSAVMDGGGVIYLTLMLYTGESPWASETMLNRVINIYSFDLGGDMIKFISTNENQSMQMDMYRQYYKTMSLLDIKQGKYGYADKFSGFLSDNASFPGFIAGYGDLDADGGRGYKALANAAANNGENTNLASYAMGYMYTKLVEKSRYWGSGVIGFVMGTAEAIRVSYSNVKRLVVGGSGYSDDELDALYRFFLACGVIKPLEGWDILALAMELCHGNEFKVLLQCFHSTTDLKAHLNSASLKQAQELWKQLNSRGKDTLKRGLLGYYNLAVTRLLNGMSDGTDIWSNDWNYYGLLSWARIVGFRERKSTDSKKPAKMVTYPQYMDYLTEYALIPRPGAFDTASNINQISFPTAAEPANDRQALLLIHGTNVSFTGDVEMTSIPRASVIDIPDGKMAWVEPYEWNEEIQVAQGGWIEDEEKAEAVLDAFAVLTQDASVKKDILANKAYGEQVMWEMTSRIVDNWNKQVITGQITDPARQIQVEASEILNAAYGRVWNAEASSAHTIPAHTYPVSYRMRFPEGTIARYVDIANAEGSSNTSVRTGALLFSDTADDSKGDLTYTSNIVWQRETGKSLEDSGVLGSAIDTGALDYGDEITLMLITEGRVKFYPSRAGVLSAKNAYELTNEELLSSTGFTPYTESGTLAAVTARVGSADVPAEKYKDKNQVQVTQEKVAKALNSSRVGTIQAATSFTMLSDDEVLISAYDSGLTMLRLNDTHDILHLQGGSYYQSFPERGTGKYKVVGYDTEEYAYGSMDLARAKVYDFDLVNRRTEIYLTALQSHLDQLAVDYVRRLHRTRVEITQDKDGKTLSQKTVTVAFEDDASEEAASERLLFGTAEGPAMEELRRQEQAAHISHTKEAEEYLRTLRGRVLDQQRALNEIFLLTRASTRPLIAGKLMTDPYWVGLMERVQAATDSGELKDILVEIVTNEDMIRAMEQEAAAAADPDKKKALEADAETYRSFRETLDYKKEEEYQNETLTEAELDADSLTKMLDNRKTPKDYEEKYSEIIRNQGEKPDPLAETLKLDGIMNTDRKSNDPDRMRIRSLVLEDIENDYLKQHPVKPDKAFDPDGTYKEVVPIAKEDEAWENYLKDLLYRINPKNLAAARAVASEEFADLTWKSARTMENGTITSTSLSVDESVRTKMRQQMLDALNDCETVSQVEALFFGTQIKNLGNPYGGFRADYTSWENNTEGTEADRAKAMRASDWYKKLKNWLISSPTVKTMLNAKSQSWEQYIQSVITHRTGRVLRDEETGEKVGSHTNASSVFAQLVEFLCEGAGEVDQETKINMVEDLLIGMYNITGSQAAEEAVLIERMTLPAYSGYLAAYEAFNAKSFEPVARDSEQTDDAGTVSFRVSDEAAVRQLEYREQDFYKKLILSMRESELVKAYLKSNNESWEQYMASLPVLAQNENITDPESSARKIYETFKPFRPLTKEDQPEASDGQEARPTFESMSGEGQMNDKGSING